MGPSENSPWHVPEEWGSTSTAAADELILGVTSQISGQESLNADHCVP